MNHFATILTIGDELLIGQVFDTNSTWIAQQLNLLGYQIKQRIAIADNKMDIIQSLENIIPHNHLIIITGGLGPTNDDITKIVLSEFFQSNLQLHTPTLQHIQDLFLQRNKTVLLERNIQQAYLPESCIIIKNRLGTAPGMLFKKNNCTIIALPGVPYEMKTIFKEELIAHIALPQNSCAILHKTLITADIVESHLAEILIDFEKNLPTNIKLAYLPNHFLVRLRLSCYEINDVNSIIFENKWNDLKQLVKPYIISEEDISLEKIIGELLTKHNKTISTAESCTGGYISHLLTKHSGSSTFYIGSLIAYHNHIKKEHLDVTNEILTTVGVVSIEAVEKMATSVLKKFNTDYAIAVSGIMGPTGNTPEKPIGMVCIGIASKNTVVSKTIYLKYDREKNIELTAMYALHFMRKLIVQEL